MSIYWESVLFLLSSHNYSCRGIDSHNWYCSMGMGHLFRMVHIESLLWQSRKRLTRPASILEVRTLHMTLESMLKGILRGDIVFVLTRGEGVQVIIIRWCNYIPWDTIYTKCTRRCRWSCFYADIWLPHLRKWHSNKLSEWTACQCVIYFCYFEPRANLATPEYCCQQHGHSTGRILWSSGVVSSAPTED